eukprot:scaffold53384_cov28-Prasinocladus_malaysianus.AAC.1
MGAVRIDLSNVPEVQTADSDSRAIVPVETVASAYVDHQTVGYSLAWSSQSKVRMSGHGVAPDKVGRELCRPPSQCQNKIGNTEQASMNYESLMTELRKLWKDVALVVVPVGGADTTFEVMITDRAERFYKDQDNAALLIRA